MFSLRAAGILGNGKLPVRLLLGCLGIFESQGKRIAWSQWARRANTRPHQKCGAGEVYEPHAMRIRHRKGATMKKIMFVLAFSVVLVFLEGLIPERRRAKAMR